MVVNFPPQLTNVAKCNSEEWASNDTSDVDVHVCLFFVVVGFVGGGCWVFFCFPLAAYILLPGYLGFHQ